MRAPLSEGNKSIPALHLRGVVATALDMEVVEENEVVFAEFKGPVEKLLYLRESLDDIMIH